MVLGHVDSGLGVAFGFGVGLGVDVHIYRAMVCCALRAGAARPLVGSCPTIHFLGYGYARLR